jgi:hypothetical protein
MHIPSTCTHLLVHMPPHSYVPHKVYVPKFPFPNHSNFVTTPLPLICAHTLNCMRPPYYLCTPPLLVHAPLLMCTHAFTPTHSRPPPTRVRHLYAPPTCACLPAHAPFSYVPTCTHSLSMHAHPYAPPTQVPPLPMDAHLYAPPTHTSPPVRTPPTRVRPPIRSSYPYKPTHSCPFYPCTPTPTHPLPVHATCMRPLLVHAHPFVPPSNSG